jgi:hypothetical protein
LRKSLSFRVGTGVSREEKNSLNTEEPSNTEKMPVFTSRQHFSEILRKTAEKTAKMFSLVMRIYLLTVDKGCEGLCDPLPLRHGAEVEGQVNPLVRDQHRLEGRLRSGHSL